MTIFGDPIWAEALSFANVVFFGFLAYYSFRLAKSETGYPRFLRMAMGTIGSYWAILYVYVFFAPSSNPIIDPVLFGQVFVRAAFTLTGAIMASLAIYKCRTKVD